MALSEQVIPADSINVRANGALEVREAIIVLRGRKHDPSFPPRYHRYVLEPGDDVSGKDERIRKIAEAVWTADVLAAWQASMESLDSEPAPKSRAGKRQKT